MPPTEEWRSIEETDGRYHVSDAGRVRGVSGRVLKPTLLQIGYYSVAFSMGDYKILRRYVHRLVAEAFLGAIPADRVVNHKNADKLDNRLENLELIDRSANAAHWARPNRSKEAGRTRSGLCGRGHDLANERTYCNECRRQKASGQFDLPPTDVEWRESSAPGYLVSADGRVWSRKVKRVLRHGINSPGYCFFNLRVGGRTQPFAAHRLVAEAFIGPLQDTVVVDHVNGNKLDNSVANLRIVCRADNTRAFRRRVIDEDRHGFSLTGKMASEIMWLLQEGSLTQRQIAERYGVSPGHVSEISTGRKWIHSVPVKPTDVGKFLASCPKAPRGGQRRLERRRSGDST